MAYTVNGLSPCPGGDCHGIDHAWCAPGRHAEEWGAWSRFYDSWESDEHYATYVPRHRKDGPVPTRIPPEDRTPLIPYLHN